MSLLWLQVGAFSKLRSSSGGQGMARSAAAGLCHHGARSTSLSSTKATFPLRRSLSPRTFTDIQKLCMGSGQKKSKHEEAPVNGEVF